MPVDELNGAFERISRAEEHLADLRNWIADLYRRQQDSISCQFDPNFPYEVRFDCSKFPGTPFRIGVLIGEICYNLRSALDYLVFALAKHDSGVPQEGTQFPIDDKPKQFQWNVTKKARLKGLNPAHIAAIERLQPYNGNSWVVALRDISNMDKHREFAIYQGRFLANGFTRFNNSNFDRLSYPIIRTPHPVHGEVDVKVEFTSEILFPDGTPIIQTLEVVKLKVAETLDAFKSEFK